MKYILMAILGAIYSLGVSATNFDHSHSQWSKILTKIVSASSNSTVVDYIALKNNPLQFLDYLKALESVSQKDFQSFNSKQQLAFLINAYNAYTIKLIIDNYPVQSIKDIGGIFSSPWQKKFIPLLGKKISLDEIEHEKIRKNFEEPRIHFAVVCASVGCPAIRNEAYIGEKLDSQLEDSTINFLKDTKRNRYSEENKTLEISSIFKWYEEDFKNHDSGIKGFILKRITSSSPEKLSQRINETKVTFFDYDWALNKK